MTVGAALALEGTGRLAVAIDDALKAVVSGATVLIDVIVNPGYSSTVVTEGARGAMATKN